MILYIYTRRPSIFGPPSNDKCLLLFFGSLQFLGRVLDRKDIDGFHLRYFDTAGHIVPTWLSIY